MSYPMQQIIFYNWLTYLLACRLGGAVNTAQEEDKHVTYLMKHWLCPGLLTTTP